MILTREQVQAYIADCHEIRKTSVILRNHVSKGELCAEALLQAWDEIETLRDSSAAALLNINSKVYGAAEVILRHALEVSNE